MYKAIEFFTDLHDNNHPYNVGDIFPRSGFSVTAGRLAELAGRNNKRGNPVIQLVEEERPKASIKKEEKTAKE